MTNNIKDIFEQNIILLSQIDKSIYYFRMQEHDTALGIIADSMDLIRDSIEAIINDREYFNLVSTDSIMEMLSGILEAYKSRDYILLSDYLDYQLVSFVVGVQELIIGREEIGFEENIYHENLMIIKDKGIGLHKYIGEPIDPHALLKDGYRVEFTSCGLMTLAAQNGDASFYFHTNGRISAEAFILAKHWFRKEINRYIIYGLGFGYHIYELLYLSDQSEIIVYESDLNVVLLACTFTKIKDIFETGRVKLVYDPEFEELRNRIKNLSQDEVFYVHYPSFQNIRNVEGRLITEKYVSWSNFLS